MLALSACKIELNTGLEESEANEMLAKLLAYNVDASKRQGKDRTVTLLVEEAQFGEAVELLKRFGLPREKYATMDEIFASDGLVSSPTQEWARLNFALRQELSKTISAIPGVISAEVHVANPRKEEPFEEPPPPSASVLVLIARDAVTADLIPQIKRLVAFAVENVDYDRVGVMVSPVDPPATPPLDLVEFGGLVLRRDSYPRAFLLIAGSGFLCALCTAAGTVFFVRSRKGSSKEAA